MPERAMTDDDWPAARDLAVIIPTRERWDILDLTLNALRVQTASGFETVVVVDGKDQQIPELGSTTVFAIDKGGAGAARNAAVRATSAGLLLLLGDDTVPEPDLVERHLARHRAEPDQHVAVLGDIVWHREVADSRLHRWLDWSATQFDYRRLRRSLPEDAGYGRFFSSNVSVKRELYEAAGGFDEEFVYLYDDLDLGYRMAQCGMVLRYEPEARTYHLHRYDWPALERRFTAIANGERMMAAKHREWDVYFRPRLQEAAVRRPVSPLWSRVVDRIPDNDGFVRKFVEQRADLWYQQKLAPGFLRAWEASEELDELRTYLGAEFNQSKLFDSAGEVDREEEAAPDELTFYRTSRAYLYDLTSFAMTGTKLPYREDVSRVVKPGARLLDYGCGIGSDGLRFLQAGYQVSFADFDNPSIEYLRWRLARHGLEAPIYDVDQGVPGGFDAVYCFDVIEHVDDPWEFLRRLEATADVVIVNFLESRADDVHVHHSLPIDRLLDHAQAAGLVRYRRYHGRSQLVAYRSPSGGMPRSPRVRLVSAARRRAGQALNRWPALSRVKQVVRF